MRLSISLLASLGVVGPLSAQAVNNEFFLYSGVTNFTTRSTLGGGSDGELCQRYPGQFFNGIGQFDDPVAGQVRRIAGMRWVIQDQSGVTQEPFECGAKLSDPAAPDNVDPTVDAFRIGPFNTPASTVTTAVAWIYTSTLATPFDTVPAQEDIWAFVDVPANGTWSNDGLSIHMSGWGGTPADNPNLNATIINFTNTVDQTAITNGTNPQAAVGTDNTLFLRIWFTTPGAQLKLGSDQDPAAQIPVPNSNPQTFINPNYGCAGLYPDQNPGRNDGLAFRFLDANLPGALVTVLGNFGPATTNPPIPVSAFVPGTGEIFLDLPWISASFMSAVADPNGVAEQVTFPWPFVLPAPVGVMTFQAFALDVAQGRIVASNLAAFDAQ